MGKTNKKLYNIFITIIICFFACYVDTFAYTVCEQGKYVSKCGDYYVGTNWLKGYKKTKQIVQRTGLQINTITYTEQIPDYFDYSNNADEVNIDNLRKFFSANETMIYTPNTTDSKTNPESYVAQPDTYKEHRDEMLNDFCNPNDVVCEKCPGNGVVEESTFDTRTNKWGTFKTIADCYMTEYTDSTGTYVNIKNNSQGSEEKCYFMTGVNYVDGSVLGEKTDTTKIEKLPARSKKKL